jgi:Tfp pilus assembly protein PilF
MKMLFMVALALIAAVRPVGAQTAQETYIKAVRAYQAGEVDTARQLFEQVLQTDPQNKGAIAFLGRIRATSGSATTLKLELDRLMVPSVDFRDASLSAVLDFLPQLAQKESGGKMALNIVRAFPKEYGEEKMVTLALSNVPMSAVLTYVGRVAGVKIEYQPRAVVVSLPEPAAPTQPKTD